MHTVVNCRAPLLICMYIIYMHHVLFRFCIIITWLQGNGGREEQSSKRDVRFADGFDSDTITAEKQRANALYQVRSRGSGVA